MLSRNAGVGSVAKVADEESCRENVEWMQRERYCTVRHELWTGSVEGKAVQGERVRVP